MAAYGDSCVLLSLLLGDSGYTDSERWLINQGDQTLWISHWVLLEVAGVVATCVRLGHPLERRGPGGNWPERRHGRSGVAHKTVLLPPDLVETLLGDPPGPRRPWTGPPPPPWKSWWPEMLSCDKEEAA